MRRLLVIFVPLTLTILAACAIVAARQGFFAPAAEGPGAQGAQGVPAQHKNFIRVEGAGLQQKLDAARARGRAEGRGRPFWVAYSFEPRRGIAVDVWLNPGQGPRSVFSTGPGVALDPDYETRNLAIFLLYGAHSDSPQKVEVYNLDTRKEFGGHPVYWLERASAEESLGLLKGLARSADAEQLAAPAAVIIALHDDPRVGPALEEIVRTTASTKVRDQATLWLAQVPGELPFLTSLARDTRADFEFRRQAIFAIGVSRGPEAVGVLQELYDSTDEWELKKHIIYGVNAHRNEGPKLRFLKKVAESDPDPVARKEARFWLDTQPGRHAP
jgi:HEAT repeats